MQEQSTLSSDDMLPYWLHQKLWLFWLHDLYYLLPVNLLIALLFITWNPSNFLPQCCFMDHSVSQIKDSHSEEWKLTFSPPREYQVLFGRIQNFCLCNIRNWWSKQTETVSSKVKWDQNQDTNSLSWPEKSKSLWAWGDGWVHVCIPWDLTKTHTLTPLLCLRTSWKSAEADPPPCFCQCLSVLFFRS